MEEDELGFFQNESDLDPIGAVGNTLSSIGDSVGGFFRSDEPEPISDEIVYSGGVPIDQFAPGLADQDDDPDVAMLDESFADSAQPATFQSNPPKWDDWRVRLSLAPGADYLYAATDAGILSPLKETRGILFPYTPQVRTTYKTAYERVNPIHSNFTSVFYRSSSIDDVSITGVFTANDTYEANYLLAVLHFVRSVSKMFYGSDSRAGTPPPVMFLNGYGEYGFNQMPLVLSTVTIELPDKVDYVPAGIPLNDEITKLNAMKGAVNKSSSSGGLLDRLSPSGLLKGGGLMGTLAGVLPVDDIVGGIFGGSNDEPESAPQQQSDAQAETNEDKPIYESQTYVPSEVSITLMLIPVQSREQVMEFSLDKYATGEILKTGGIW